MRYVPNDKTPGDFLRQARKKAKLMQGDVAEELGYASPQFVSNWERGVSLPPIDMLPYLAKILRVPHIDLINKIFDYKVAEIEASRDRALKKRRKSA